MDPGLVLELYWIDSGDARIHGDGITLATQSWSVACLWKKTFEYDTDISEDASLLKEEPAMFGPNIYIYTYIHTYIYIYIYNTHTHIHIIS